MLARYCFVVFSLLLLKAGPGCSKLTKSLVNETLKFQTAVSQICPYFWLKKCVKPLQCFCGAFAVQKLLSFFQQNISVFRNKVVKHLTS